MTEITAEQVKTLLESFAALCGSNAKAKELCGDAIKFVEQQAAEIAKKDRMLGKACGVLAREKDCDNCPVMPCNASSCAKSWRAWLEKEAEEPND